MRDARDEDDDSCDDVDEDAVDVVSDVSLRSCNSTEALRQWTMSYPVTATCQSARPRRRQRRPRRSDDDDDDDDEGSAAETDIKVTYRDCDGNVRCQQPACRPRKPCSLVRPH